MMTKKKPKTNDQLSLGESAEGAPALRVLSFSAKMVAGIREAAIEPDGRAVIFEGRNATGKTSWLTALAATIGGGSLAKLVHTEAGEEIPETVLVIAGNGEEYRVEKKGDDTARVLKRVGDSQAFADVPRPQQFLSQLFDSRMSNPVAWLLAKPKDQALLLLEALPLEMDADALAGILKPVGTHVRPVPAGLHPLEELRLVREQLFTARTGVNRDATGKRQAAEQLRRELPAKAPKDPASDVVAAEKQIEERSTRLSALRQRLASEWEAAEQAAHAAFREAKAELEADFERKLRQVEETRGDTLNKLGAANVHDTGELAPEHEAINGLRERLATLREQDEQATRFFALDEQAKGFDADAERHEHESQGITATMLRLDEFRRALAKDLPIPGLEIEGTEIRLDGVPLPQVNEGLRVEVAAKVAQARADLNPLKILFLDGLERLDTVHRKALLDYLVAHGIQAFGAVVTDGGPAVKYIGAVTEVAANHEAPDGTAGDGLGDLGPLDAPLGPVEP